MLLKPKLFYFTSYNGKAASFYTRVTLYWPPSTPADFCLAYMVAKNLISASCCLSNMVAWAGEEHRHADKRWANMRGRDMYRRQLISPSHIQQNKKACMG